MHLFIYLFIHSFISNHYPILRWLDVASDRSPHLQIHHAACCAPKASWAGRGDQKFQQRQQGDDFAEASRCCPLEGKLRCSGSAACDTMNVRLPTWLPQGSFPGCPGALLHRRRLRTIRLWWNQWKAAVPGRHWILTTDDHWPMFQCLVLILALCFQLPL